VLSPEGLFRYQIVSARARDIEVVALRACRFTPGEKGGQQVPVRVRGFKIRFLLGDP
jgi:hypothetical protein